MFLYRVAAALDAAGVPYAVAGGYAVALHGAVRGTLDIDLVLRRRRKDFLAAESALRSLGLRSRLPVGAGEVFDFREEYMRNKNLVAWSFHNPRVLSEIVDIIVTHDLARMGVRNMRAEGRLLRVLAKKDLIAMKKRSGRPQDLEDVRALEALG